MPLIRFTESLAGAYFSYHRNQEVDLPHELASRYLAQGVAELVTSDEPETPERKRARPETRHRARNDNRR